MRKKKSFTLIELMIVVIIIAILASVGIPQYFKAAGKAQENRAKHNLGEIRKVELAYESVTGTWSTFASTGTVNLTADLDNDGVNDVVVAFSDAIYSYDVTGAVARAVTAKAGLATPLTINLATGVTSW